ncbi:MAG: DUF2505 domain-containing protein [Janthinobacterium lividum]
MPASFSERFDLPADPVQAFAVLVDPAFLAARAVRSDALQHTSDVRTEGTATVVTSSRTVRTTGLPAAAAKFLGDTAVIGQVERWEEVGPDGSRDGSLTLTVEGAPVTLAATARLRAAGAACVYELIGTLSVRVPLLGGGVERATLPGLLALIRSEVDVARQWLQRP